MGYVEAVIAVLKMAWALWDYFRGTAAAREAARIALAQQFTKLESQGYPIMTDLLRQMGRASWVPWEQVKEVTLPKSSSPK